MTFSVTLLQQLHLLRLVAAPELAKLAPFFIEKHFARREVVLARGDLGLGLGFLLEGKLQGVDFTVDGREAGLYFVDVGDYFAELPVVDGQGNAEFIIAIAKSRVLFLPREMAREWIGNTAHIAQALMQRLGQRIRTVTAQRTLLTLPNPFQRLCVQLLPMIHHETRPARILNAPTHQELAIMINSSRETVTRAFQLLQNKQVILRDGNDWQILQADFLADIASGRIEPPKT